ncbi:NADPH-dependent conjugated polyketone reductase C2 [Candida viswanathii]|uniref:NADPH-dependent conjugated polyketone reductase C2 n=1 Tax=Candida viswanathii TaxID=5486 RepID=A0A367YEH3_9ASCO|nr:NADPH-dependent conjugated polyketone reductase C2 [Candida viswanathii]
MAEITTASGDKVTIGIGSGTSVKDLKRGNPTGENQDLIVDLLRYAIDSGFNHIDTAEVYTTQPEVGRAIEGYDREKLWITTKYAVSSSIIKKKSFTPTAFVEQALQELGTGYIDLLLIHSPPKTGQDYTIESLWEELVEIKKAGKVRFVGVSNFNVEQLQKVMNVSQERGVFPLVNQIQYYVGSDKLPIVEFSKENGIIVEAYGPLTPLRTPNEKLDVLLGQLEKKYDATKAQILLRALLARDILPITTSFKKHRLEEAIQTYKVDIDQSDLKLLESI